MLDRETTSSRSPTWWNPDHDTAWTRVKAALHRDWEQTKSDFTGGRQGTDLNQGADDTVAQALGNLPIPSDSTVNSMSANEREAHVARAAQQMERSAEALAADTQASITKNQARKASALSQWTLWEQAERRIHSPDRIFPPAFARVKGASTPNGHLRGRDARRAG